MRFIITAGPKSKEVQTNIAPKTQPTNPAKNIYLPERPTVKEAFNELRLNPGTQFDKKLVEEFILAYKHTYGNDLDYNANVIEGRNKTN